MTHFWDSPGGCQESAYLICREPISRAYRTNFFFSPLSKEWVEEGRKLQKVKARIRNFAGKVFVNLIGNKIDKKRKSPQGNRMESIRNRGLFRWEGKKIKSRGSFWGFLSESLFLNHWHWESSSWHLPQKPHKPWLSSLPCQFLLSHPHRRRL